MYIAGMWSLFGKTLLVSHLSMLPFVLGTIYFSGKLVRLLISRRDSWFWTTVLLFDAAILAQFTLVSPDVWILFFLSMAIYALLAEKRLLLTVAVTGLTLTSTRGMMLTASLFFAGWLIRILVQKDKPVLSASWSYIRRSIPVYLVPFLIAFIYLGLHYYRTGWIGYHSGMPWAIHFQRVNVEGFFRNIMVLAWRLTDNGRIFTWITGLLMMITIIRKHIQLNGDGKKLLILLSVVIFLLSFFTLTYRNLFGHRYLIPVFYLVTLTVIWFLVNIPGFRYKKMIGVLLMAGMMSGNFWVYPDHISKGWDAMLSYLPYQSLRKDMISFIEEKKIDFQAVGTDFPNNIPLKYIDLTGDTRSFGSIEKGIGNFRYVFYSNVFNGFSDGELNELSRNWKVVNRLDRGMVKVILYENPSASP